MSQLDSKKVFTYFCAIEKTFKSENNGKNQTGYFKGI